MAQMASATHFHAMGEPEDLGKAPGTKMRGPINGVCRCAEHIAGPMMATRQRPACEMRCYMCERIEVLAARLGK